MRFIFAAYVSLFSVVAAADVYRCAEPRGITMWSNEGHKPMPDGFKGVNPVVILEQQHMTVVWGDTKAKGSPGTERVWKAVIFDRGVESVSAFAVDSGSTGVAAMLYTLDTKRHLLYMSTHKTSELVGASTASSYVSKCQ